MHVYVCTYTHIEECFWGVAPTAVSRPNDHNTLYPHSHQILLILLA